MKRNLLALAVLLFFNGITQSQSPAELRCAAFGKGQNLSNWLEASWQSGWPTANGYTKQDLEKMKEAGFESIRLPAAFAKVTDTIAPYQVDFNHPLFERIDSVIRWCDELQMSLIIDNHHEWDLTNQNWRNNLIRFGSLWGELANHYKYLDPDKVSFELLNEPGIALDLDSLNIVFNSAIDSIRKHTTTHSIIVCPNFGSWGISYSSYVPLADTNLIYTFHCYDPINFTHQGFAWGNPTYPSGQVFPDWNNFYQPVLYQGWNAVADWKNQYHKPIFLGEFGVSHFADATSKCNWVEFIGSKLLYNNIPWFYWDWRYDFSMFNGTVPSEDSVIPCYKHALRLYGDTSFSAVQSLTKELQNVNLFPSLVGQGEPCKLSMAIADHYAINVIDASGACVFRQLLNGFETTIPTNMAGGIYFVRISNLEKSTVRKLVIY